MAQGMNPVLILTRNCLELTKRCVESVRKQDIPTEIYIFDNDSTDGTVEWVRTWNTHRSFHFNNYGVSLGWNLGLTYWFDMQRADHVLVCGNDTVLAPWTYSALLSANVGFVTGVDIGMSPLPEKPDVFPLSPHPDFSLYLIRREVWEAVGPFDERMKFYVQDCDMHVRAHRLGIPMWKAAIPYQHERSSTLKRSTPEDKTIINTQANLDRKVFQSIYGCQPGTPAYNELFK